MMSGEGSVLQRLRAELPGADERGAHPEETRSPNVRLDVVSHEPGPLGLGLERVERSREVGGARLAEDYRLDAGRVLEPRDESTASSIGPRLVCHHLFLCRQ